MPLTIRYQDTSLVVVHKPAGLLVHRTQIARQESQFAVQILRDQLGRHVYPAHRLDRGTSGLLIFSLNALDAKHIAAQFASHSVYKRYLAIVRGHPDKEGLIDHPLTCLRDPYAERPRQVFATEPEQSATTHYRRLATVELPYAVDRYPTSRYALLALEPLTGRRHQLRRHLKHIAHPIIGDATYGKGRHNRLFKQLLDSHRLLLACVELRFIHPQTGRQLTLHEPPAADFMTVVRQLGWAEPH